MRAFENFSWNDEHIETLKALWAEGFSGSQIAARMGGGLTKSSVIGKAYRLGLQQRIPQNCRRGANCITRKPGSKPRHSSFNFARTPPSLARDAAEGSHQSLSCPLSEGSPPPPFNIALEDLKHGQCRFPYGAGPFKFCGHPGSPYCEAHMRLCYQLAPNLNQQRRLKWQNVQQEQAIAGLAIPKS